VNLRTTASNPARMPGFGDLPGDDSNPNSPDYDPSRDEAIDDLAQQYERDPAKRTEAADWIDGTLDGDEYAALNRWLCEFGLIDRKAVFAAERSPHVEVVIDQLHMMAGKLAELMKARLVEMAAEALAMEDAA
jgi:hypothetical protein